MAARKVVSVLVWLGVGSGACTLPHARVSAVNAPDADALDVAVEDRRDDHEPAPDANAEDATSSDAAALDAIAWDADGAPEDAALRDAADSEVVATLMDGGPQDADVGTDGSRDAGIDGAVSCEGATVDCGDGRCRSIVGRALTCAEAEIDGVHVLSLGGAPWCAFCRTIGTGSRWTLVMKVDGTLPGRPQRFAYDSPLWTNDETWAPHEVEREGREFKSRGFSLMPVRELLVEMNTRGAVRTLSGRLVPEGAASTLTLRALFAGGDNAWATLWSEGQWTGLVPNSRLQPRCVRVGVNVRAPRSSNARVRLGAIANNDLLECDSHDSWVGVGGFNQDNGALSAGNFADFNWPEERNFGAFASLWIR